MAAIGMNCPVVPDHTAAVFAVLDDRPVSVHALANRLQLTDSKVRIALIELWIGKKAIFNHESNWKRA